MTKVTYEKSDNAAFQVLEMSGVAQVEDNKHANGICHYAVRLCQVSAPVSCWCQTTTVDYTAITIHGTQAG